MKYYFRLLWLLLTRFRRPPCPVLGPCVSTFRVWPNDLDVFMHMNNGAYLTIADLGRIDLLIRSDTYGPIRARGWYPVIAGESIRFRRSLRLGERYTITSRILGWNERSLYIEQVFERVARKGSGELGGERGGLVARALIDARFLARGGARVGTAEIAEAIGFDPRSPELPRWVLGWRESMREMELARGEEP